MGTHLVYLHDWYDTRGQVTLIPFLRPGNSPNPKPHSRFEGDAAIRLLNMLGFDVANVPSEVVRPRQDEIEITAPPRPEPFDTERHKASMCAAKPR